jgi:hypothetical protein
MVGDGMGNQCIMVEHGIKQHDFRRNRGMEASWTVAIPLK